jgi:hypothetical protein
VHGLPRAEAQIAFRKWNGHPPGGASMANTTVHVETRHSQQRLPDPHEDNPSASTEIS